MQTTLLGLAIAIILAIVAAIVAPLVVDWNHYRAPLEAEASRLTGLSVRIKGSIDARLVPSPVITLTDVEVGGAGEKPQLRAAALKLELSLGPLLRGKLEATEAHLIGPRLSLSLDRSGALALPKLSRSFHASEFSIAHFTVEDGRVTISDAESGRQLALEKLWFNGDIGSLSGPFSGNGAAVVGDELYGYRISGGSAQNGTRISLAVDPSDHPLITQFDGVLTFSRGVPQFDGALNAARPVGATLAGGRRVVSEPWRLIGTVRATPASASLRNLAFRYGPEERALDFTGSADLTFGAHPALAGKIAAMQLDVDRALADPDVTDRPPLVLLRSFLSAFAADTGLPMPAQIGVSIDALTVGGATLDSLSGEADFGDGGWSIKDLQFHAPGLTTVGLSGRLTQSGQNFAFSGPATLATADTGRLLAWIDGSGGGHAGNDVRTFKARGEVTIASDQIALAGLDAALNAEKITGKLAYVWAAGKNPARLDAELRAGELDLDALSTFARSAFGADHLALPQEATLALDIGKATFAGVAAQSVSTEVKFDSGTLQISRLSIGDLAGAKLDIGGRIDALSSQPRGQITLDLAAGALDGLSDVAAKLAPQDTAFFRHAAGGLAPANLHAVLDVEPAAKSGSDAEVRINGSLAAMRIAIDGKATGEPSHPAAANVQFDGRIDADDGTALVKLLDLDHLLAVDQLPGRLTLSAAGPLNKGLHVDGKIETSGFDSAVSGTLRVAGAQAPSGRLQVQASAGDLRPLHQALTGQPGDAVPVKAQAALTINGADLSLGDVSATIGQAKITATLAINLTDPIGVGGDIAADHADVASVAAVLLGLPRSTLGPAAPWSSRPLGNGAFTAIDGAVKFKIDRADFIPTLTARDLTGELHWQPSAIALEDLAASLDGGRVTGALDFKRNPDGLGVHAKIDLTDVAAAPLIGSSMNVTSGRLTMALTGDGFGASPAGLIASLHGSGKATLQDAQFAGLDVGAFDAARQAMGDNGPSDLGKIQAAVNGALADGRLTVRRGEAALTIASGAIDMNHVTLAGEGGAQLALNGAIDLGNAAIEARMTLSEPAPPSALIGARPELSLDVSGPLAAPRRSLDTSALTSWLALSAAELQTRRIEMIEADQRAGAAVQSTHPAAPDVRLLSPGTVVETTLPPNVPSTLAPGPRGIERLQLPKPPAPPPDQAHPSSGSAAPATGAPTSPLAPTPRARQSTAGTAAQSKLPAAQSAGPRSPGTE